MRVLILAGGLGTRLRSCIADVPKPMAPVQGKPFLEHIVNQLRKQGFTKITLLTGYLSEVIESHFGDGRHMGLDITYSKETEPLGTGGAVYAAIQKYPAEEHFLLVNGDTYFDVPLKYLANFHMERAAKVSIALKFVTKNDRYGHVELDPSYRVLSFAEKKNSQDESLINGGVYCLSKSIFHQFESAKFSLEQEFLPKAIAQGVFGVPFSGRFLDIGIPEDYSIANEVLLDWLNEEKRSAVFFDRDSTLIKDPGYVHRVEDLEFHPTAIAYLKSVKRSGFKVFVTTNQAGVAKGKYTIKDKNTFKTAFLDRLKEESVEIDDYADCVLHRDAIIPELKRDSYLRKPFPGMILNLADLHSVDLFSSLMIGDSPNDLILLPYLRTFMKQWFEPWPDPGYKKAR